MSFIDCINNNSLLTKGKKESLVAEYETLVKKYTGTMGDVDAAQIAAQELMARKSSHIAQKKMNDIKDVLGWQKIQQDMIERTDRHKSLKVNPLVRALHLKSDSGAAAISILQNTQYHIEAVQRKADKIIWEVNEKYGSKLAGFKQDVAGFKLVTKELLGESTGDAAASADAKSLRKMFDYLNHRLSKAGGFVGYVENYFPQRHVADLMTKVSPQEWADYIFDKIDINKMIDSDTGLPFSEEKIKKLLPSIYDNIVSNGLIDLKTRVDEGKVTYGKSGGVAKRHEASRFFVFKDPESFLAYNQQFGVGDGGLFEAMRFHVSAMSRDIGLLESLGTKPDNTIERILGQVKVTGDAGNQMPQTIRGLYDVLSGKLSYAGKTDWKYDRAMDVQNLIRASLLSNSALSAIADGAFAANAARLNGLPAMGVLKNWLSLLNPADATDRRIMRRNGFIASSVNGRALKQSRFMEDSGGGSKITSDLASIVHRAGGLGAMTDAVSNAVPQQAMGFLAEMHHAKIKFSDLPDRMLEAFDDMRITEADYDNFLKSELWVDPTTGADFLDVDNIAKIDPESAVRFDIWLSKLNSLGSNEPSLLTRAIQTGAFMGDASTGTLLRATTSSTLMFKSFILQMTANHLLPALRRAATPDASNRFRDLGFLLTATTVFGGISVQATNVAFGLTPQDMNTPDFLKAAMLKGGGFGFLGDFAMKEVDYNGSVFSDFLLGPFGNFAVDVSTVGFRNAQKALDPEAQSQWWKDSFKLTKQYAPIDLWYTKTLTEQLMLNNIEEMIDPDYYKKQRRIEERMDEKGQRYWFSP